MNKIDNSIKFVSINIGLVTISDSRNEDNDKSGNLLKEKIKNFGHIVYKKIIIKDDLDLIKKTISDLTNDTKIDAIITTGGIAGLGVKNDENLVVTLKDRIQHHYTTGISTIEMAVKKRLEIGRAHV